MKDYSKDLDYYNMLIFILTLILISLIGGLGGAYIATNDANICGIAAFIGFIYLAIMFGFYLKRGEALSKIENLKNSYTPSNKRHSIPPKLRDEIFRRDDYTCQYCGKTINEVELHIDHIKPVSKGGTNAISNLQTLCRDCNLSKSNK